jgi:hypothetical protein
VRHFIDSLRDEVQIIKRLPKRFNRKYGVVPLEMPPVSWSNEKYYLQQVCVLFTTLYLIGKKLCYLSSSQLTGRFIFDQVIENTSAPWFVKNEIET